ncbi:flagellin [Maridesulfovibrio sp. FT414]|uniref:flagellin N-terminal helical domain-containing protein n=1 Tax=Maridesulfovibrio sp. FT414 TaxID=2979469 RepID=UPI003D802341
MGISINHNLMAVNTTRNLSEHYGALSVSTRRLSSGLRIGTAADDAAGLAIRELMRSDITSIRQGLRNASDAISLIQTADGALQVIDEKLIRMKELATQAATGTYNSDQRLIIDSEYKAMANEINRIANATDFNGIHLLNGNLSGTHNGNGLNSTGELKVHFGAGNDSAEDYYYIQIGVVTTSALGIGGNLRSLTTAEIASTNNVSLFFTTNWDTGSAYYQAPTLSAADKSLFAYGSEVRIFRDNTDPNTTYAVGTDSNGDLQAIKYTAGAPFPVFVQRGGLTLTAGKPVAISTQQAAQQALETLNKAIVSKDKIRANLGATQNRLQNTITNLSIQGENLQAAESRISDVDVAQEMTEFVRRQILTQSSVAMLSQANNMPRMVMQLIG